MGMSKWHMLGRTINLKKLYFYFYIPRCFPQEAVGSLKLTSVCTTEWERAKVCERSLRNRPGEQSAWHLSPSLRLMLCLSPSMSRTTHPSPGKTGGVKACDSFKSPQPGRRTSTLHLIELGNVPPPTCVTGARYCDQSRNQDGEALGRQGDRKSLFIGKLQRQAARPTPAGNDMFIGSE